MSNTNKDKAERHKMMDSRMGMITKQNAMMPGGPDTNTPFTAMQSEGTPVAAKSIYGDHDQNDKIYPQTGTGILNPTNVGRSPLLQANAVGQRLNAQPFNTQQQPDVAGNSMFPDGMESARLAQYPRTQGMPSSAMGLTGMPAIPGGFPGDAPGTSGPELMSSMVPGSSPQKIGQKKKGGKA